MTFAMLLLALAALALACLPRAVHRDGLGTRRPPRSHHDWWEAPEH